MRSLAFGVSVLMLGLALGCGKTRQVSGSPAEAGASNSGESGETGSGGEGGRALGGSGGRGASGGDLAMGASSNGGAGGAARMLPPDPQIPAARALHKLDLLLMIDNSRNTGEKQQLLKDAVDWLLQGGAKLPTDDIHIGVVSSSLGSHGSKDSRDVCTSAGDDDHAHLLGSLRPNLTTFKSSGFLAWGPDADPSIDTVIAELDPMIDAAGETGCGFEASLEAWYRFLVEPDPPAGVVLPAGETTAVLSGVDDTLLAQRSAFLRPDSVLAIVMLTDENDCSVQDAGYGWLVTRSTPMFRATSACVNPNDKCCQSCGESAPRAGCPAFESDPECARGPTLTAGDDDLNLRCFDQQRRFGFDLLQPISRYTEGLTRQLTWDRNGAVVSNPIFAGQLRHPSQVIFTGIVGVPWQDLADKASLTGAGLSNLTADELTTQGRWQVMLGDPSASPPLRPSDPFMIEATYDRAMLSSVHANPLTGDALVPSTSMNPRANGINGHEFVDQGTDLQPACLFPLQTPKVCDDAANLADKSCRCYEDALSANNPACQPPAGGPPTTTQYYEQAYPGIRHLELLQSLGNNGITGSACPKVTTPGAPDYGYRPVMKALATRLQAAFNP